MLCDYQTEPYLSSELDSCNFSVLWIPATWLIRQHVHLLHFLSLTAVHWWSDARISDGLSTYALCITERFLRNFV